MQKRTAVHELRNLIGLANANVPRLSKDEFLDLFYETLLCLYLPLVVTGDITSRDDAGTPQRAAAVGARDVWAQDREALRFLCTDSPNDRENVAMLLGNLRVQLDRILGWRENNSVMMKPKLSYKVFVSSGEIKLIPDQEKRMVLFDGVKIEGDPEFDSSDILHKHLGDNGLNIPFYIRSSQEENMGLVQRLQRLGCDIRACLIFCRFIDTDRFQTVLSAIFRLLSVVGVDRVFKCSRCGRFGITTKKKQSSLCSNCQASDRVKRWREGSQP